MNEQANKQANTYFNMVLRKKLESSVTEALPFGPRRPSLPGGLEGRLTGKLHKRQNVCFTKIHFYPIDKSEENSTEQLPVGTVGMGTINEKEL